jgi:hypothetical protein
MSKTLRMILIGATLIGAAVPALAQTGGGNGGGGGGAGGGPGGGSSNVWDASIPGSAFNTYPPTVPPRQQPVAERRDDTCGQHRSRQFCRPR